MKKFLAVFILSAMLFSFGFSIGSKTPANSLTAKTYSQTYSERSEAINQQAIQKTPQERAVKNYDNKLTVSPSERTYVPVRFIVENLGYEVNWDGGHSPTLPDYTAKLLGIENTNGNVTLEELLGETLPAKVSDNYFSLDNIKKILPDAIDVNYVNDVIQHLNEVVFQVGNTEYAKSVDGVVDFGHMDVAPYIDVKASRTLVPLRFVAESMGADVGWDAKERKVTIKLNGDVLNFFVPKMDKNGNPINPKEYEYYLKNGLKYDMDVAAIIKNSRTFVPIRFVAESLGVNVGWDGATKKITLKYNSEETIKKEVDSVNWDYKIYKNITLNDFKKMGLPVPKDVNNELVPGLSYKTLFDWMGQFDIKPFELRTLKPKDSLNVIVNAYLGLDPNKDFNIVSEENSGIDGFNVPDKWLVQYFINLGNKVDQKNFNKVSLFNTIAPLYSDLDKATNGTIAEGTLLAIATGTMPADHDALIEMATSASNELNEMYNNRAYKKKADNTEITIDDLISRERVSTLIALNSVFANEPINILLSQSPTLQKAAKEGSLQDYKDLVDTLYKVSNEMEVPVNKKIKDLDVFKKYINQLGLFDHNAGEYAVQMWKQASPELREEIKQHPKLFLSYIGKNRAWVNAGKVKIGNREYDFGTVFQDIVKCTLDQIDYVTKTEKYFQEKGYELYQYSGYGDKIENLPFIWMQGSPFTPGLSHIELIKKKLSYGQMTLKEAIQDLMTTKGAEEILNIAEKRYHDVPIGNRGCVSNFLGPGIGPKEYGSKPATLEMWVDVKVRGPPTRWQPKQGIPEAHLPYGQIISEHPTRMNLTREQTIGKLIDLLQKNNPPASERIPTYNTGDMMAVEKIVDDALIRFTIERKWKSYHSALFLLKDKNKLMDVGWINQIIMLNKDFGNPVKSSSNHYWTVYLPYETNPNSPLDFGRPFNVKKGQVYDLSLLP